jgi:tetratricopeptide (TPR) repeat protein
MAVPFDPNVLNLLARDLKVNGIALLAGAGVSLAPPACAPLFRPLRDGLLRTLSESLAGTLEKSVLERCRLLFSGDSDVRRGIEPVPEVLFEALHDTLQDQLFGALRILLDLPAPNSNHRFAADLANHGLRVLITTNFEDGFEQAFRATGCSFTVCADGQTISRSLSDLNVEPKDETHVPIWKVHGTLQPGAEETIRVTLSQIARERLDPRKFEPITALTSEMPILVVGYSGYDADISRTLISAGEMGRRLYWLSYSEPRQADPSLRILQSWQERGHLLVGDLKDLFSELAKLAPGIRNHEQPASGCDQALAGRFAELEKWAGQLSIDARLEAFAVLCWKLSDYESALAAVDALEKLALQSGNGKVFLFCLVLKTNILRSAGRGREIGSALNLFQQMRERMAEIGDPEFIAVDIVLLHELGGYFRAQGERATAEDAYRKALALSRRSKEANFISMVAQSLGALLSHYQNHKESKELFELALASSLESGDRYGELKAIHELGILAFEMGKPEAASELLTENIRLAHEIGDAGIESSGTFELGVIALRVQQDSDLAHSLLTQAYRLSRLIGNKTTELSALLYLGDLEQVRNNLGPSIEILTKCALEAAAVGDGSIEATALSRRARSHALLGERDEAEADLGRARSLAERWHPALIAEIDGLAALLPGL